ncbi:NrfD/PsrC family molybdoenzyme membrane anchor subunit [Photobacterium sp. GSS17]|uniref:NrfD/PsrC family molybdoenzyme membrane anchor subunit n=1 Tax=Photobacterium sp. GSS17 TaxID=3020715 RepID=UPI0023608F83|nr:NrfD/PsrC family molybdoenzyme membrane anchor subunit [Photobacterium sp. GSS17]
MNITEILVPPQAIAWLPWAVQYFFYIGSAYAAAIMFFIALAFENHTSHRLRAALALTMAIGAIVGPLALTGDLHQPGRAWHFYPHFTPWSWMSLGAVLLPLFTGLAIVTTWLYLRPDLIALQRNSNKVLAQCGKLALGQWQTSRSVMLFSAGGTVLSGLSIALYTGAEIAVVTSRPLWHQPASPVLWFVTAFLGAVGFSLIIWLLFPSAGRDELTRSDLRLYRQTMMLSGLLALLLVPIWASNNPAFSLFSDPHWLTSLIVLAAALFACVILALGVLRTGASATSPASRQVMEGQRQTCRFYEKGRLWLVAVVCLLAGWFTRWVTMMQVQTIPKADVGPYPYHLPLDGNGLLGIAGMFGLWLALALLASELLQPRQPVPVSPDQK